MYSTNAILQGMGYIKYEVARMWNKLDTCMSFTSAGSAQQFKDFKKVWKMACVNAIF